MRRNLRQGRGQSLVELALLLPVLLLILVGVVDVGRAFHAYLVVTNSAREAARYGAFHADQLSTVPDVALAEIERGGLDPSRASVTVEPAASGEPLRVTVTYQFDLIMGAILGLESISLQSSMAMVTF
ncbi:MAG TPA: pilus assembly protein [Anaerolineae bacterium]|nr:pilus assembly protein [Anaerolineae bacterium]